MPNSLFRVETLTGQPMLVRNTQVHLRSQVVQLRLPFGNGGLIWNRPVSVVMRTPDGQEQILSVPDVTRTIVIMLLVASLVGPFLLMLLRRKSA